MERVYCFQQMRNAKKLALYFRLWNKHICKTRIFLILYFIGFKRTIDERKIIFKNKNSFRKKKFSFFGWRNVLANKKNKILTLNDKLARNPYSFYLFMKFLRIRMKSYLNIKSYEQEFEFLTKVLLIKNERFRFIIII